jgi:hypothetical protein
MRLVSIVNPLRGCNSNLAQCSNTAALRHHSIEHEDEHERRTPNAKRLVRYRYSFPRLSRKKSWRSWRHSSWQTPAVIKQ